MFRPALVALVALWAEAAYPQRLSDFGPPRGVGVENDMLPFPRLKAVAQGAAGGGTLIGSDYDSRANIYQFKFIKNGVVTLVYVDARSGNVVGVERG